ncbi:hypothetical protein EPUL_005047 [Erysiphe pulchra]|uniref:Uncharacterized protein n=1 Tax=Erysiphe pulchra TaxID=225359 RepID=A0A2S4PLR3_9PEZI|nr:hypothetical protein EPUL_005047 [Erysiphe pulchra]
MAALKQDFGAQDMDKEDYPHLWLEAIHSRVSRKAEVWMDQTLLVTKILLNRNETSMTDVVAFESEFRSRLLGSSTAVSQPSNLLYAQSFKQDQEVNGPFENDFSNLPLQSYEEATEQRETTSSRTCRKAADSLEIENIVESSPVNFAIELLNSENRDLASAELNQINLSGSLENFSVAVDQEKNHSIKEIFNTAHTEVTEAQTSRKRRHVDFDELSNS